MAGRTNGCLCDWMEELVVSGVQVRRWKTTKNERKGCLHEFHELTRMRGEGGIFPRNVSLHRFIRLIPGYVWIRERRGAGGGEERVAAGFPRVTFQKLLTAGGEVLKLKGGGSKIPSFATGRNSQSTS